MMCNSGHSVQALRSKDALHRAQFFVRTHSSLSLTLVELSYNVMKGTEYFVSL
jgi:hypothetical protein